MLSTGLSLSAGWTESDGGRSYRSKPGSNEDTLHIAAAWRLDPVFSERYAYDTMLTPPTNPCRMAGCRYFLAGPLPFVHGMATGQMFESEPCGLATCLC